MSQVQDYNLAVMVGMEKIVCAHIDNVVHSWRCGLGMSTVAGVEWCKDAFS